METAIDHPTDSRLLGDRVRVLRGERVPTAEKLVSLFEPHPQIYVRQQVGKANSVARCRWTRSRAGS